MKKYLFVMIAVLLLAFSAAYAQETETIQEINWEDIAPAIEETGIEGDFYDVAGLGLKMWIPSIFEEVELEEEDVEDGMLCFLTTADAEAYVSVYAMDGEGASLEEWAASFEENEDTTDVELVILNGIAALSFVDTDADTLNVAFTTDTGYLVDFAFNPASDEDFAQVALAMASSIQAYEE